MSLFSDFVEIILKPIPWGFIWTIVGFLLNELLKDRLHPFLHKKRTKEMQCTCTPQIQVLTMRSEDDIEQYSNLLSCCTKILRGNFSYTGENEKCSVILSLTEITQSEIKFDGGNWTLLHIENPTDYNVRVKSLFDSKKNSVSFNSPELSYFKRSTSITLLLNAYTSLSKVEIDYNGHQLIYIITNKDGYIIPAIK